MGDKLQDFIMYSGFPSGDCSNKEKIGIVMVFVVWCKVFH